ncbi:aminopeptidase N [Ornithinimicrobium pekingense]|uniref:Aminopeptidase N n=1 Tax=Ornithinimicrobium pekingense TaxID=384677 RepID=A0ABQ2FC52_9MICO|nr:aminopeptidase N [Ornithinimicrobium pekingense]GGK74562.1 aminopeptidase [Ornithinimicrobium pekingense]
MPLTLPDARARARTVREVSYEVHLDLRAEETFVASTTVTFSADAGTATFLDLQHAREVRVWLDGVELPSTCYRDDRVHLSDLGERNVAVVEARLPFVTDGDGMNRFVDPVDGEVYVGCYGGMDVARRVFACFDQPDLKAPFTVSVTAPDGWRVLSNGTCSGPDAGGTWRFGPIPPVATYLVAVCAGAWASRTWEHAGQEFGWHCRPSQQPDLDRDLPQLRTVTEAAFDDYAGRFTEPYAFGTYDQVFVPGHNWGAMETPGCVTFRDEMLPPAVTEPALARRRARVIAHEMAHMWFGDLVTFRWWEDTWLNESFADYMGFLVGGAALPGESAFAEFDISSKAGGYAADGRPTSHPVAPRPEDVPDVDTAFNNFDSISYAKGNSCLRQLAFWLGEETFFRGVDRHLSRHRFGTATLEDLVESLGSATDRDVRGWAQDWLRTTGHDTVRVLRPGGGEGHGMPFLRREGARPHRLRVHGYRPSPDGGLVAAWEQVVDLAGDVVALPEADLVVPNSTGETFARVVLDDRSRELVADRLSRVPDEHPRIMVWATLLDEAARAELPVHDLVTLVERHLPQDRAALALEHVLSRAVGVVEALAVPAEVPALLERLCAVARAVLDRSGAPEAVVQTATGTVVATAHDRHLLRAWLADGGPRGPLAPTHRWDALVRLATLGEDVDGPVRKELGRDGSSLARLAALAASAAVPRADAKAAALHRLTAEGTSNREIVALARGLWSPEQRELTDPLVPAYLDRAPGVAGRGQALALVVGRATPRFRWTGAQLAALEEVLGRPGLPPVLARTWADLLHDQRRADRATTGG